MSKSSVKNKLDIQTLGSSLPAIEQLGEITKHPQSGQLLVANNSSNWEPISVDPASDVPFSNYYVVSNISSHTSPSMHDLVYETSTNILWRYHGDSASAHVWQQVDWRSIASIHPEYSQNRLRYTLGFLQISPDGSTWYQVYPLVGARAIRLSSSAIDNTGYSRIFWLPIGVTANISGANHLPIAFAKTVRPVYSISSMSNTAYEQWVGLRPNDISLSDGYGVYISSGGSSVGTNYAGSQTIFPFCEQSTIAGENRIFGSICFSPSNENVLLSNTAGLGDSANYVILCLGRGTISSTSYWFGTWRWQDGTQYTPFLTTITREY